MKLISCHIENFGALKAFDCTFNGGLNALYSPNGGGKSTIAAFIKAMFYGLPADSSRSRFNERRHYYPFSGGGNFGGNLIFEWRGATYRIERFFDRTSGEDVKVFREGKVCRDFPGGQIGQSVFGLDEQSFARTLYFGTSGGELTSTGGINAKLAEYASAAAGNYDADGAVAALEKASKNLQMRGGKGEIPRLEGVVSRCRADISNINAISERLGEKYAMFTSLSGRLSMLEQEERSRGAAAVTAEKWARYDDMRRVVEQKRARLNELKKSYPEGFPTDEELSTLSAAAGLYAVASGTSIAAQPGGAKKSNRLAVSSALSFFLAIIMLIGGMFLMPYSTFAGLLALGAGGVFVICTFLVLLVGKRGGKGSSRSSAEREVLDRADGLLKKYGLADCTYAQAISRASSDSAEYRSLFAEATRGENAAREYARANGLTERPAQPGGSAADEANELRRKLAALNRDISDDESIVETLGEKQAELDSAVARLEECRAKLTAYTAAMQFIKDAERTLNSNFVKPVGEAFARYSNLLKSALGGTVRIDKNFSVIFEADGQLRSAGHLSSGQRAVVALCFRLALIDNMFASDLPFVLLDDPFADLDEEHTRRAAQLLRDLSKDRQIIYFYCHAARKM